MDTHVMPPSDDLKAPEAAAYTTSTFEGSTVIAVTFNRVLALSDNGVQLAPLLVDFHIPPPGDPI